MFGLAVSAPAVAHRQDVLLTNLASYGLFALCGVVAPLTAFPHALAVATRFLPLTNGLLALRHVVDGQPWSHAVELEACVGLGWAAVAAILLTWYERRSRKLGSDDLL